MTGWRSEQVKGNHLPHWGNNKLESHMGPGHQAWLWSSGLGRDQVKFMISLWRLQFTHHREVFIGQVTFVRTSVHLTFNFMPHKQWFMLAKAIPKCKLNWNSYMLEFKGTTRSYISHQHLCLECQPSEAYCSHTGMQNGLGPYKHNRVKVCIKLQTPVILLRERIEKSGNPIKAQPVPSTLPTNYPARVNHSQVIMCTNGCITYGAKYPLKWWN